MGSRKKCAYCGRPGGDTADHVPPKNLFTPPRPTDLVTVPACRACHGNTSKDDEYFRLKVCMSDQAGNHPQASWAREVALRSLLRPQARGMRASFVSDLSPVSLWTRGGLFAGRSFAYSVDLARIFRVVERTVRGLYYHETGSRLPDGYGVRIHSDDTLRSEPADVVEELQKTILCPLAQLPRATIGDGVFAYQFYVFSEDPGVSVWALSFYARVPFLALTGRDKPAGQAEENSSPPPTSPAS